MSTTGQNIQRQNHRKSPFALHERLASAAAVSLISPDGPGLDELR